MNKINVIYDGDEYEIYSDAYLLNEVFDGWWGEAEEGDYYSVHYAAKATDSEGETCLVIYEFVEIKGNEIEDAGDYPWDDDCIVEIRYP